MALAGTTILAEIGDRTAEYRIAEGYRAMSTEPKVRAQAERLANQHRTEIQKLQSRYATLLGAELDGPAPDSFRKTLRPIIWLTIPG